MREILLHAQQQPKNKNYCTYILFPFYNTTHFHLIPRNSSIAYF